MDLKQIKELEEYQDCLGWGGQGEAKFLRMLKRHALELVALAKESLTAAAAIQEEERKEAA